MSLFSPLAQTFNVGTDLSLSITRNDTNQQVVLDGKKTRFSSHDKSKLVESQPIDDGGRPDHRVIPGGWTGTIEVDKSQSDFAVLYATIEEAFYDGLQQVYFTLIATEPNADGSGTQRFAYRKAVFHGYDPGTWEKENITKAKVEFDAAERVAL